MLDTKTGDFRIVATITLLWCGTPAFFKIFMTRSGKTLAIVIALLRKLFSSTAVKVIGVMGHAEMIGFWTWTRVRFPRLELALGAQLLLGLVFAKMADGTKLV